MSIVELISYGPVQTAFVQHIDILHEDTEERYDDLKQQTTHADYWVSTLSCYTTTILDLMLLDQKYANYERNLEHEVKLVETTDSSSLEVELLACYTTARGEFRHVEPVRLNKGLIERDQKMLDSSKTFSGPQGPLYGALQH